MGTQRLALPAPVHGTVIGIEVVVGQSVAAGQTLLLLEAMKMEVALEAQVSGVVRAIGVAVGDVVDEGSTLVEMEPGAAPVAKAAAAPPPDPRVPRPDLQVLFDRRTLLEDAARPEAVARRHAQGGRTARENLADLLDAGSLLEYGAYAVAAQRSRRSVDDLQRNTPADGMVTGIGTVNALQFGPEASRTAVLAYDYTVLAGTQGWRNHKKKDRLLGVTHQWKLPMVLFAEGGGGRPGDVDMPSTPATSGCG